MIWVVACAAADVRWDDPPADDAWHAYTAPLALAQVEPFEAVGPHGFFALRRYYSDFDHEDALRPYVFRVEGGRVHDLWRGTALARPIVAARLMRVNGDERLCVVHRGDSFLRPDPATTVTLHAVYAWTGFGFRTVDEPAAQALCGELRSVSR